MAVQISIPFTSISLHRFNNSSAYGRHNSLLRPFIASLRHELSTKLMIKLPKTIPRRTFNGFCKTCTQKLSRSVSHSLVAEWGKWHESYPKGSGKKGETRRYHELNNTEEGRSKKKKVTNFTKRCSPIFLMFSMNSDKGTWGPWPEGWGWVESFPPK